MNFNNIQDNGFLLVKIPKFKTSIEQTFTLMDKKDEIIKNI